MSALGSVIKEIVINNQTVDSAVRKVAVNKAVVRSLDTVMEHKNAVVVAPILTKTLQEAITANATTGTVSKVALNAAFKSALTMVLAKTTRPFSGSTGSLIVGGMAMKFLNPTQITNAAQALTNSAIEAILSLPFPPADVNARERFKENDMLF